MPLLPNQEDVHYVGSSPQTYDFARSIPHGAVTSSSGGGTVRAGPTGTEVDPGGTAGDTATLSIGSWIQARTHVIRLRMYYETVPVESSYDNIYHLGFARGGSSNFAAYLDLTNEQYVLDGSTQAAIIPSNRDVTRLDITIDLNNGETTFEQSGSLGNDSATFNTASRGGGDIAYTESNGFAEDAPKICTGQLVVES